MVPCGVLLVTAALCHQLILVRCWTAKSPNHAVHNRMNQNLAHDTGRDAKTPLHSTTACDLSRGQFTYGFLGLGVSLALPVAAAQPNVAQPTTHLAPDQTSPGLVINTLQERVTENALSLPSFGVESPDVYYPGWFAGLWVSQSVTKAVDAPLGVELFGGNRTYEKALNDLGSALVYKTRFRPVAGGRVVADRTYNIESISKAAMGPMAVLNTESAGDSPDRIAFFLSPAGAKGAIFRADLQVTARRSELPPETAVGRARFDVCEVVRQTVQSQTNRRALSMVKDVETTTLYERVSDSKIRATQRTAMFLVPADPYQRDKWERSRGKAVDVRTYEVTYTLDRRLSSGVPTPGA